MKKYQGLSPVTFQRMKRLCLILYLFSFFQASAQKKMAVCGTKDDVLPQELISRMSSLTQLQDQYQARTKSEDMSICRIAVEIDSETYLRFSKDTSAIIHAVMQNIESCSEVYEREINTHLLVTSIRIRKDTEPDPYIGTNYIFDMLNILSAVPAASQNYDKRMYLFTRQVTGATGVADIGGPLSVSPLNDIHTIMHELGHNFGSPHTQNCAWPGGPIDYCIDPEGGCYDKSLEASNAGTIMSYCGSVLTFHPLCQALMKSFAELTLTKIQTVPQPVTLTGNLTISRGDYYSWSPAISAKKYQVSYSVNSDFSGEIIEELPFSAFSTRKLIPGQDYYLRIRAVNSLGASAWSEGARLTVIHENLEAPQISAPVGTAMLIEAGSSVNLSFTPVDDAFGYEIQTAITKDINFDNPVTQNVNEAYINFTPPSRTALRWRVRAVRNDQKGTWSDVSYLIVNATRNNGLIVPLPDNLQDVSLSFPFTYLPLGDFSQIRITIADNIGFSNPVVLKDQEFNGLIKNLPANKNLFLRVQEWNTDRRYYPDVPLADYTLAFRTGSKVLPANLTFMSEIDPAVFGQLTQSPILARNYVWCEKPGTGFIRIDPGNLTYKIYNRSSTDGLIGAGTLLSSMRADREQEIHFLSRSTSGSTRRVDPQNEDLTGDSDILRFYDPVQDFNPDGKLLWDSHVLLRDMATSLIPFKSFPDYQYIMQVRALHNKVWILIYDENKNANEIIVTDLNDASINEVISFAGNGNIKKRISQVEVSADGILWLKQDDLAINSIARFDGNNWSLFDTNNSPFGNNIASLSLSPNGGVYLLVTGNESKVFKFKNSTWEDMGISIPLQYFGRDLLVDNNENIWFSEISGLSRLTSGPPLPVTLVDFKATSESKLVTLSWKVTDEINMEKYVVELSIDGKGFLAIGESSATNSALYNFIHQNPLNGQSYYRLKMVETNGDFAYSRVISLKFSEADDLIFFPNPTAGRLSIKIKSGMINQSGLVRVVTMDGREINKRKIDKLKETEFLDLSKIAAGLYVVRIENEHETITRSIEVIR